MTRQPPAKTHFHFWNTHRTKGRTHEKTYPCHRANYLSGRQHLQQPRSRRRNEVVLELECENAESARQALKTLPSGKEGLIYFELIPLRKYTGFESLFHLEKVENHDQKS